MHDQISYPARILLIERATDRRYSADAIPVGELCDLERDTGACCIFDGPPRYQVDGVERPDFDPTIPDDLYAAGWRWVGGSLCRPSPGGSTGVVIGMPRESLHEVWEQARTVTTVADTLRAELAAAKAQKPSKKPKPRPQPVTPTPVAGVTSPAYAQVAMELV